MRKTFNRGMTYGVVLIALLFSSAMFSCSKQGAKEELLDATRLSENQRFASATLEVRDFIVLLVNAKKSGALSLETAEQSVNTLFNSNQTDEAKMQGLKAILGSSAALHVTAYTQALADLRTITSGYANVNQEILEQESFQVISQNKENVEAARKLKVNFMAPDDGGFDPGGGDCGWRYTLCVAAATAGAILCNGGCTAATMGIGVVGCAVICSIGQVYAGVVCFDTYCKGNS